METVPSNGLYEPPTKCRRMNGESTRSNPFLRNTVAMIKERRSLGCTILLDGETLSIAKVSL